MKKSNFIITIILFSCLIPYSSPIFSGLWFKFKAIKYKKLCWLTGFSMFCSKYSHGTIQETTEANIIQVSTTSFSVQSTSSTETVQNSTFSSTSSPSISSVTPTQLITTTLQPDSSTIVETGTIFLSTTTEMFLNTSTNPFSASTTELSTIDSIIVNETSKRCPAANDVSFLHLFNWTSNLVSDRDDLNKTVSDMCHLSAFRCKSDKKCGRGRKCCTVAKKKVQKYENEIGKESFFKKCKICIFVH